LFCQGYVYFLFLLTRLCFRKSNHRVICTRRSVLCFSIQLYKNARSH